MGLAERIHEVMAIAPEAGAVEFERRWRSWGEQGEIIAWVEARLAEAGLPEGTPVAVVIRNRPSMAAAALAVVASRRMLVTVNPHQSPGAIAEDFAELRTPAIILDPEDWQKPEIAAAARAQSRLVLGLGREVADRSVLHSRSDDGSVAYQPPQPGVAIQMLSSGTTGKPKRINLASKDLEAGIWNLLKGEWARDKEGRLKVNTTPGLIYAPLGHISGLWFLHFLTCDARPFVLLERFDVAEWVERISRHRLKNTGLVPSAMRMVMHANVPKEKLASLVAIGSGTAPLPVDLQEAFEARYGVAVLPTYGSTEFAGAVAGWSMEAHRGFAKAKRGAAGKAFPGTRLRVIDPETERELSTGETGLLEVSSNQLRGGEWVRTTDLALIDSDGFLFIKGRADGAINRGGFKILPDEIENVLRRHPDVHDAAVVGIPDARLGQIPAAAVEPKPGHAKPSAAELDAFARQHLVVYKVPARILVLDALPRTNSMKPILPAIRELFAAADQSQGKA
jgi:acyl-coenzyme A synthetase/AMP-(fatty) acid ligase